MARPGRVGAKPVEETAASTRPKRAAAAPAETTETPTKKQKTGAKRGRKAAAGVSKPAASSAKKSTGKVGRPAKVKKVAANGTPAKPKAEKAVKKVAEDEDEEDDGNEKSYWLMKAEPESRMEKGVDVKFSIDDLREAKEPEPWDGVRNPGARNNMRAMRKGDLAFFYHSNCKVPGIAGVMEIVQEHSIDESAFDTAHPYYDPKSTREAPKWEVVHVEFRKKFKDLVKLTELKSFGKPGGALENLQMLKQGRLSVSAVTGKQWKFIMGLTEEDSDT